MSNIYIKYGRRKTALQTTNTRTLSHVVYCRKKSVHVNVDNDFVGDELPADSDCGYTVCHRTQNDTEIQRRHDNSRYWATEL